MYTTNNDRLASINVTDCAEYSVLVHIFKDEWRAELDNDGHWASFELKGVTPEGEWVSFGAGYLDDSYRGHVYQGARDMLRNGAGRRVKISTMRALGYGFKGDDYETREYAAKAR